jgi:exonuclease SbcD
MKILHTSDWHLGRTLYSKKERKEEHAAFFEWLLKTIEEYGIELLLVAGDIFDTGAPSSNSQKMYYDFLIKVKNVGCQNIIIVGGNHDSPSFLNAPKDILAVLNVVVVGNVSEDIKDQLIIVKDQNENPQLIVCAVPFLRERDISRFSEGESYTDRSKRINENIKKHYEELAVLAENTRDTLGLDIPIIATGHLSVAGGKRNADDGVREIYIGNIEAVGNDIFPDTFDYVALGHYHIPSAIKHNIRYCGSPIPMGFGEVGQNKCVYVLNLKREKDIETIEIPVFQKLESIEGDKAFIINRLDELKQANTSIWAEIIYNGDEIFPNLSAVVTECTKDSQIEVIRVQNRQFLNEVLTPNETFNFLEELTVHDVFEKLLEKNNVPIDQQEELQKIYKEIVFELSAD